MLLQLARVAALVAISVSASVVSAQQLFSDLVGPVSAKPVREATPIEVPYITWGGDVATFLANGGVTTASGSIYDGLGLKLKLTAGDDFVAQWGKVGVHRLVNQAACGGTLGQLLRRIDEGDFQVSAQLLQVTGQSVFRPAVPTIGQAMLHDRRLSLAGQFNFVKVGCPSHHS